jgi:hypothetical protein
MAIFCRNPRKVLSRDDLLEMLHGRRAAVFDRSIDVQISRLRHKLEAGVKDPRFIAAVRNIDMSTVTAGTLQNPDNSLLLAAIAASRKIFNLKMCNPKWYCSRSLYTVLEQAATNSIARSTLSIRDVAGQPVTHLNGIPLEMDDQIINTELSI